MLDNEKRFHLDCDCGSETLLIQKFDDDPDLLFLSYFISAFNSGQDNAWDKFKNRMKIIWTIARGKEFRFFDIIINKNQFEEFRMFINE